MVAYAVGNTQPEEGVVRKRRHPRCPSGPVKRHDVLSRRIDVRALQCLTLSERYVITMSVKPLSVAVW